MPENRLYRRLFRMVGIKPGEESISLLLFGYLFLITAPYTIIKSLRYALLMEKMGIEGLPQGYFLAALVTGVVVVFRQRIETRISAQGLTLASLAFFTATGLVFWLFLGAGGRWLSLLYWIWAYVLIVVLMTHFWLTVNQVLNPREAKRLIGFFGSGGLLGGVFGGLITFALKDSALASHLMLLASGMLGAGWIVARTIFLRQKRMGGPEKPADQPAEPSPSSSPGFKHSLLTVLKNRYLRFLSLVVFLTIIISTAVDFLFMDISRQHYPGKLELQAFLGLFFAGLNLMAFFIQLLLTSRFLKDLGIRISLIVTPLALSLLTLGVSFWPGLLLPAILLKGGEEGLEFSLGQSARELLYIPVKSSIKTRVKVFIDMFVKRFAKAVASLMLAPFGPVLAVGAVAVPILILLTILVFVSLMTYREYRKAIKMNIRAIIPSGHEIVDRQVDMDFTRDIFDTLAARSRSEVLYAMHIYSLIKDDRLTPEVEQLIALKSGEVKAASLSSLFDAEAAKPLSESEEIEFDREGLITEIDEIVSLPDYQTLMQQHADLVMVKSREAETEKMELAKAIGLMEPGAPLTGRIESLILDDSPEVARYAMESASRLLTPRVLPAIISRLSQPAVREDAVSSLCRFGSMALAPIRDLISDPERDLESRIAGTSVLSRIGSRDAAHILLMELAECPPSMETAVIQALDRIRSNHPGMDLSSPVVQDKIQDFILEYFRLFLEIHAPAGDPPPESESRRMRKRLEDLFQGLFTLLGVIYPRADINQAIQNIGKGTPTATAFAVELLDNTLKKSHRDWVIPMIEALPLPERLQRFRRMLHQASKD
jgi:AAA family ATP:ADP antiporter